MPEPPSVTIVYVVYNRRDELRISLRKMLVESDYAGSVDVIVVDNASSDGSADMVRAEFPQVRLIVREENIGAPAWNDGFAIAQGDWVLILDDDCYLPRDGLTRALEAATAAEADMVSFRVLSTVDPDYAFTDKYRTGLFTFWGCAWLVRRPVIQELGGYDPELFIWANELEFTMRFLDRGYRHLHLPTVAAHHMKAPGDESKPIDPRGYKVNARHWGYVAGKLLAPRDAAAALVALAARCLRDSSRVDRDALGGVPATFRGFVHGLRHRAPVRPEVSHFYRRNFETFASPWWLSRPLTELVRALPAEAIDGTRPQGIGRREQYYEERSRWYPTDEPAVLQL